MNAPDLSADANDPSDPSQREAQTYPRLAPDMIARIASRGREERVPAGTLLFERGRRGVDFFLVLEGEIEVFEESPDGERHVVTRLRDGQFAGELDLFSDREILVSGEVAADTRVIRVSHPDFRALMSAEPDLSEIVMRAYILRRVGLLRHTKGSVVLLGDEHDGDTLRLQRFLTRNGYPFRLVAAGTEAEAAELTRVFDLDPGALPALIAPGPIVLCNPSTHETADRLGISEPFDRLDLYDVAVIGAGPAGLAAAVYAASEGLSTIVIEQEAPGGQAGTSSRIENYLGFPTGISGAALAGRAQTQAQKFGAKLAVSRAATALHCTEHPYRISLDDGESLKACTIVVATGASYRKLDVPDYERFEGEGIQYAATAMEAQLCEGEEVVVVGGGNSAGQAAVFLSRTVAHVHILVRGDGLAETMSDYLVQRIDTSPRISIHAQSEITALAGDAYLREVTWTNRTSGASETKRVGSLFVMIGAEPNTGWLCGCLPLDAKGFVRTGQDDAGQALGSPYETTVPGIFAVGDVRSGSVKRVASSVGEGSVVVQAIHAFLQPGVA